MRNEFFKILLVGLVLFCLIGAVSASESMIEHQLMDDDNLEDVDDSLSVSDCELIGDDEKHKDIYVNSSKEIDGDGLSPETAYKSLSYDTYTNFQNKDNISNSSQIKNLMNIRITTPKDKLRLFSKEALNS